MAVEEIITGGAHISEKGSTVGVAGDQKQTSSPDYQGEVSLRRKNQAQFKSTYSGYTLYRLINPGQAFDAADLMIRACNNGNIGYSQTTRQGIFNYGVDSEVPINCDCSSLVSYCLTESTGSSINTTTSGLAQAMNQTGLFMEPMSVASVDFATNPPYNGDVLLKAGSHVELVVAGNPREGSDNEITSGSWVGNGSEIQRYSNNYGRTYAFSSRTKAPTEKKKQSATSSAGSSQSSSSSQTLITSTDDMYYQYDYGETYNGMYAWGRFSEILHAFSNLCRGIPRKWYSYTEDGYSRGSQILLGAVMCFTHLTDLTDPGIVCIVEKIEKDTIYVTWKHPRTGVFEYFPMTKTKGKWNLDLNKDGVTEYIFQGCIYNPAVNNEEYIESASGTFVEIAKSQVGDQGSFVAKLTDVVPKRDAWSAAFIVAVAKQTGNILDRIIPDTYACSNIGKIGVTRGMGTWFDGPAIGGNPTPHAGDIILLRTTALKRKDSNKYGADKAGIVVNVKDANKAKSGKNQTTYQSVVVVMGDVNDEVAKVTFKSNSGQISGYFRPDWKKLDGYNYQVVQTISEGGLYTEGTSLEDAAVRDLRYIRIESDGLKPSIKSSGITLSAINYTGMLANFYTAFIESGTAPGYDLDYMIDNWSSNTGTGLPYGETSSYSDLGIYIGTSLSGANSLTVYYTTMDGQDTSIEVTITPDVMTMYATLSNFLNNSSGAIGILGNIFQESRFSTAAGAGRSVSVGPCGICQWYGGRCANMAKFCKGSWENNLSGQLGYLMEELNGGYTGVRNTCRNVALTLNGAFDACDCFLRNFEKPGNYWWEGPVRQKFTEAIYQLIIGGSTSESSLEGPTREVM